MFLSKLYITARLTKKKKNPPVQTHQIQTHWYKPIRLTHHHRPPQTHRPKPMPPPSVSLEIPYWVKNELSYSLLPDSIFLIWISDQESMVMDRMKEMLMPRLQCLPEHSKHMNTSYNIDTHCGFFCEQSVQILFPTCDCKSSNCLDAAIRVQSNRSQIGFC